MSAQWSRGAIEMSHLGEGRGGYSGGRSMIDVPLASESRTRASLDSVTAITNFLKLTRQWETIETPRADSATSSLLLNNAIIHCATAHEQFFGKCASPEQRENLICREARLTTAICRSLVSRSKYFPRARVRTRCYSHLLFNTPKSREPRAVVPFTSEGWNLLRWRSHLIRKFSERFFWSFWKGKYILGGKYY